MLRACETVTDIAPRKQGQNLPRRRLLSRTHRLRCPDRQIQLPPRLYHCGAEKVAARLSMQPGARPTGLPPSAIQSSTPASCRQSSPPSPTPPGPPLNRSGTAPGSDLACRRPLVGSRKSPWDCPCESCSLCVDRAARTMRRFRRSWSGPCFDRTRGATVRT